MLICKAKLYIKAEKYEFHSNLVEYLRYILFSFKLTIRIKDSRLYLFLFFDLELEVSVTLHITITNYQTYPMILCHIFIICYCHSYIIIYYIEEWRRFWNDDIIQHVYHMLT